MHVPGAPRTAPALAQPEEQCGGNVGDLWQGLPLCFSPRDSEQAKAPGSPVPSALGGGEHGGFPGMVPICWPETGAVPLPTGGMGIGRDTPSQEGPRLALCLAFSGVCSSFREGLCVPVCVTVWGDLPEGALCSCPCRFFLMWRNPHGTTGSLLGERGG